MNSALLYSTNEPRTEYDNNGNLTSKTDSIGTTTYTWDFENRLAAVTLPNGSTVNFSYDPFGRRIKKDATSYLYDGANMLAELDGGGNVAASYVMSLQIDEPLLMNRAASESYYQADGLGSVVSQSDATGLIVAVYSYDSFGNQGSLADSSANPFLYTARELDANTGLYYYRARYLENNAGRFASEDPLGLFLQETNLYQYVLNNPNSFTDPLGLIAFGVGGGGLGIAALPKLGVVGEINCLLVFDTEGNVGVLCCPAVGPAIGLPEALGVGGQFAGIVCPTCKTICELPGVFVQGGVFVAGGEGGSIAGGVSISSSSLTVVGSAGPAAGAGLAVIVPIGNCELVLGGKECKKCPSPN
jgi:RHS repeat-associated protein